MAARVGNSGKISLLVWSHPAAPFLLTCYHCISFCFLANLTISIHRRYIPLAFCRSIFSHKHYIDRYIPPSLQPAMEYILPFQN